MGPRRSGCPEIIAQQQQQQQSAVVAWGNHRVSYDVLDDALVVTVVRAGNRREVYDR